MNRRDAFRVALAAAVSAMLPKQATPVDEIAEIFGVPPEMLAVSLRPDWSRLLADDPIIPMWNEMASRMAVAMAEKIDAEFWGAA